MPLRKKHPLTPLHNHNQVVRAKLPSQIHLLLEMCYPASQGALCLHALSTHADVFWSAVLLFDTVGAVYYQPSGPSLPSKFCPLRLCPLLAGGRVWEPAPGHVPRRGA